MMAVAMALATALAEHPALSISLNPDQIDGLRKAAEPVLSMTEEQMLALIPEQSGLYFVGCINCAGGQQEGQLKQWSVEEPDVVRCTYCGHTYPSETYPTTGVLEVRTPNNGIARYPYHESRPPWWQGDEPYRFRRPGRLPQRSATWRTWRPWRAVELTGEADYGRRAALILHRFGPGLPGYRYHFDFPSARRSSTRAMWPRGLPPRYGPRWTCNYMDISQNCLRPTTVGRHRHVGAWRNAYRRGCDIRAMLTMMAEQVTRTAMLAT